MADTFKKVKLSLDESRLLVLGAQILLGFQFRGFIEPGFTLLPPASQQLRLVSLGLMLLTIFLLMWPTTFHQIVEDGESRPQVMHFANRVVGGALLPFAVALGIDVYTISQKIGGFRAGLVAGLGTFATALFFWYGWEYAVRTTEKRTGAMKQETDDRTPLHERIDAVLTECRVVIPGSQALLGFQLAAVLMEGFERLPVSSKYVHFVSLLMITLSTILLMAPAAYHRIVEGGQDTERLERFARAMLLSAMAVLAAGLGTEFFVVCRLVTHHVPGSICCAGSTLIISYGLWFGYTFSKHLQTRP